MKEALSHHPRISVVTPSYNQGEYLEATLRSVVSQRYPNMEYVVIDGGSTDGSVDVIRRHEASLSYWTSEPDTGHAHALNKGFARTTGDIMCWLNSSDLHYPWTLATVAEVFSQLPQVAWIVGTPSQFDALGNLRVVQRGLGMNKYDVLAGDYRWIQQESVFWRRPLWEAAGGQLNQGLARAADFDLWVRFFQLATLYSVDVVLGGFRVHDNRLGETGDALYEREATQVRRRFKKASGPATRARALLVGLARPRRFTILADIADKTGVPTWYRHPRISFDFASGRWTIQ